MTTIRYRKPGFGRPIAGIEYTGGEVHFRSADDMARVDRFKAYDLAEGMYEFDASKCELSDRLKRMISEKLAEDLLPSTVAVQEWQIEIDGNTIRVAPEVWSWT